ncbi:ankyrin repeat-containing domain protein [Trichoderma sp. SZMC 28015]
MAQALTRLSPEDLRGVFDIYLVGFPPDGKSRKPESASVETVSKDPTFDRIRPKDWTQIVPQLIPEAEVFEFVPFQERETLQEQASEEIEAAAPSQKQRKNSIRSAADLDTEARLLLDCIKDGPKKRRVLAGYGLGGLVIKQAIVIANRNPRYYDATSLIEQLVFVATPHIAPNLDVWEDIAGKSLDAAEVMIRGRKTQILTDLATSIQISSIIFHCFASRYEVKNLPYGATAVQHDFVDGSSESDINSFLLYADEVQSQLNKSGKISEYDLRSYLSTPKLLNLTSIRDDDRIPEFIFESQFIDFLQQLAPSSWIFHENSAIQLLEPGVELQLYEQHLSKLQLLKTFGQGAVNITGPPGYGKTTVLKLLIQRLKQQYSRAITIDFFLESFEASSRTSNQILRSVIHQILSQRPSLFQNIRLLYMQQKKIGTWTDEILWDIFQRLIRHSSGWRIIVSINNFKHWSLESRSVFTKLDRILATSTFQYTMLTTGRGDNSSLSHEPDEVIDLTAGAEDSGKWFIKAKLDILLRKKPALAPCEKDILETASIWEGSYSHTERCLKQLSSSFTLSSPDAIAVAVETCPKSEDDISRDRIKALLQEDSHVLNWSINAVSWVMHSARPLRIQELAVAAALSMGVGDNPLADLDRHISRSMEHDLDRYLDVLIRADSQVAHIYSAATKRFLVEKLQSHFHEGDGSLKGFRLLDHAKLAILCIKYISRAVSENWGMSRARLDWRSNKFQADQSELEFLSYAVKYWPYHYHRHHDQAGDNSSVERRGEDGSTKLEDIIIEFFGNEDLRPKWYQLFSLKAQLTDAYNQEAWEEVANEEITPLEIVSELGLTAVAKRILTSDKDVLKSSPNTLSSALALSVRNKQSDITAMLLEMNAPVSSAFIEAACTNNIGAMRSLMAHGAKLNDEDHLGSVALRKAASTESLDAVKLLLGENIDVTEADTDGRSAIHAVAIGGVVEMLQNISNLPGFNINARDNEQNTALILAVRFDHVKLVRELCLKNADVTLADAQGKTALQYAVSKDINITRALLENKANAMAGDKEGQTALNLACRLGYVEVAEAMVNSLDDASLLNLVHVDQAAKNTPLHIAAKFGYTPIVKLLLSKGVNFRLEDSSGNTAIQLSASAGHLDVLRVLLEHHLSHLGDFAPEDMRPVGEDTNNQNEEEVGKDPYKITAVKECNELLCRAVTSGQLIVVRYLLNYMDSSHPSIPIQTSTPGENLLNIAASKGYTEIVRALLPVFDPNVKNAENRTPLDLAVSGKHRDVIRLLLESGADPNVSDSDRWNPLHIAAESGVHEIFEDLLRSGGDVYARTILKETALHLAVKFPNIVRLLIDASADLNAKDYNEATPLHLAVRADSITTIKLLLRAGADLDAVDENDKTPLHYAIDLKNPSVFREFWESGPKLHKQPYRKIPPLIQALEAESFDIVRIILGEALLADSTNDTPEHGNSSAQHDLEDMTLLDVNVETSDSRTALLIAVTKRQSDIVKTLLKLDADLTSRDSSGRTPLLQALNLGDEEIFDALLEKGADIDSQDQEGSTALHFRLIGLFKNKSKLNIQDASGNTPLHRAAYNGRKAAVELLLEAEANPNIQSEAGSLPIHQGSDNYNITLLLADAGSNLNATDKDGWTPLMQCLLLERDKNVNHVDKRGRTLLHIAVDCLDTDVLRRCLKLGSIDIDTKDNSGRTPLHTAASIRRSSSFEMMSILVEHGAAITTIDNEVTQKCSFLASKGVKVNEKNRKGQTVLIAARDVRIGERIWTTDELLEALSDCVAICSDNNRDKIGHNKASLLLDEIDMATWNPKQAFTALRSCFEINFIDRILGATDFPESASQVTDDDMWTPRHFRYHMAEAYPDDEELLVFEKPKGETLLPIDTDRWEVTTLSVTSKTTDNITQTFRANHPFPIRGERHAYFEAEASAPQSQEGPVNFAIGLCGEFVDFGSSLPGTRFHPSIGFQSDDGRIFIYAIEDQTQQPASQKIGPFAQSVKIGCGIDWDEKMVFFTRNGEIVAKVETPIIHWKLYPVVTVFESTLCTINVNFSGDSDHPFIYKAIS